MRMFPLLLLLMTYSNSMAGSIALLEPYETPGGKVGWYTEANRCFPAYEEKIALIAGDASSSAIKVQRGKLLWEMGEEGLFSNVEQGKVAFGRFGHFRLMKVINGETLLQKHLHLIVAGTAIRLRY